VSDKRGGLALLTQGIHEYEVTDDPSRTMIITLLRAYEVTLCTVSFRWERRPDQGLSQVPGVIEQRYAICPHEGNWEKGDLLGAAEDYQLPLVVAQAGRGEGPQKQDHSLLEIRPSSLVLSALKRAEDKRDAWIVRIHNPARKSQNAVLKMPREVRSARLVNMNEERLRGAPALDVKGNTIRFPITPGKVATVEVKLRTR
jgi:alpha-mannosidase